MKCPSSVRSMPCPYEAAHCLLTFNLCRGPHVSSAVMTANRQAMTISNFMIVPQGKLINETQKSLPFDCQFPVYIAEGRYSLFDHITSRTKSILSDVQSDGVQCFTT